MSVTQSERVNRVGRRRLYKKVVSKYWYPYITRRLTDENVDFLNYGYEEDPRMGLTLTSNDEPNRMGIQLYHSTAMQADLAGKRVLEVSCGHGGGASYLTRTMRPASYTGLDFNPEGVAYCRKRHHVPGLDFVHGDAESLPFPDNTFDAVINVEASHAYLRFGRFLAEVARVLRPGGRFLYTDMRRSQEISDWEAATAEAPMRILATRNINAEVLRGMEESSQRSAELIDRHIPALLRPFSRLFAGVAGTGVYRVLERGDASYRIYCFAKD
ncbi:phthiotriol/phenolphthiotriol dimycocerosates methyltransferase [Mycobacterium sp.]|uniref:phthiotriol/phenolphthiotriol dimycocerosates methyltransferase n=1 Tax=Mycobacterium sp. TaxID=1785 RepID=UPI0031E34A84